MEDYYSFFLAVHVVFVISWMAGLFYILSLFIYHTEANTKEEPARSILVAQFTKMEATVWKIIATPAMIISVLAGSLMLYTHPYLFQFGWMLVKLGFVAGLLVYHFICQRMMKQLRAGNYTLNSFRLRLWRELATIFMVAIVFIVILKNAVDWIYGLVGIMGLATVIMMGVKFYKKVREKNNH
ncbi:CopD family protein [Pedobacter sp. KR3-3]|uniref:Protoporphyrinogen IX oxidase n=1 Tax=Pedobacter albus TaxID=3113905 RepID=A0ABU7I7C0_9SPHI|nr:CopD family protein [Pedobacter sp. KR3-3]MEE1945191.1 CopD family protein [Pedobacter sp. KR3-3]